MTTVRPTTFYPERVLREDKFYTYLTGEGFDVPAGTEVRQVDTIAGRRLLQTETPRAGYRFACHGDLEQVKPRNEDPIT